MLIKHNKINEVQNNQNEFDIQNGILMGVENTVGDIVIPNGVTSIGDDVFYNCSDLTSIVIPNTVTSIGDCAFYGCSGLESITIPVGVTSIGNGAFGYCSVLKSITIPDSVTSIGEWAFASCSNLTSIEIPDSVTSIGGGAFAYCSGLTSITIPDSVTSIGGSTFWGCYNLKSITIPDSVTSIDDYAFDGCSSLKSLILPNNRICKCVYDELKSNLQTINGFNIEDCSLSEIRLQGLGDYIYLLHVENGVIDLGNKQIVDVDNFKYISNVNHNYIIVKYKNGLYEPFDMNFESLTKGIKLKYIEYVYGDYPIGVREDGKKCFFTKDAKWFNDCSYNSLTGEFITK